MESSKRISELLQHLQTSLDGVIAVYLFGSRADGTARPESDYDVAVLRAEPLAPQVCTDLALELGGIIGADVHLVDLTTASTVLCVEVLRSCRRLFVADPRVVDEFEMYALSDYARLNEERWEILKRYAEDDPRFPLKDGLHGD